MKTIRQSILEKYTNEGKIRSNEKVIIENNLYTIEYYIDTINNVYKWFLLTEDKKRYAEILIGS